MPFLTPGHYRIVVEMTGFKKYEKSDVQLQVSDNIYVNIDMQTGDTSQTVTVNASSDELHTADADVGVISSRQLQDLPVKDNNPLLMATLSAGVTDFANLSSGGQTQAFTTSTPSSISINGVPFNGDNGGNAFTLDCAPNIAGNNASTGQNEAFTPTTAMVQQFRIQTASYDVSSGFGPGANIGLKLKSGANALHGELDMTAKNRVFNANDWFSNHAGLPKQDNRELDWTSVLTGPVILPKMYDGKDKTFFIAYEGISSSFSANLASDVYTTLTPAERNGDLTGIFGTTSAGLSANYISKINANAPGYAQLPDTAVNGLTELSTTEFSNLPSTVWSIGSSLTWLRGNHLVKLGVEYRLFLDNGAAPQNDSGKLSYDGTSTNSTDTSSTSTFGLGIASFLLGIPDPSGSISTVTSYAEKDRVIAGYISDSWRAMPRLTVNLGLRCENQAPITGRYNHAISQFDFSSVSPLQRTAQAKYVSDGSPLLPATLSVTGGPLFAGVGTAKSFAQMEIRVGNNSKIVWGCSFSKEAL